MKANIEEPKKESEEEKKEEKDPRMDKKNKHISEWAISSEHGEFEGLDSFKFQQACARATEFSRNLANVRGTEANPQYVEDYITRLLQEYEDEDALLPDV